MYIIVHIVWADHQICRMLAMKSWNIILYKGCQLSWLSWNQLSDLISDNVVSGCRCSDEITLIVPRDFFDGPQVSPKCAPSVIKASFRRLMYSCGGVIDLFWHVITILRVGWSMLQSDRLTAVTWQNKFMTPPLQWILILFSMNKLSRGNKWDQRLDYQSMEWGSHEKNLLDHSLHVPLFSVGHPSIASTLSDNSITWWSYF